MGHQGSAALPLALRLPGVRLEVLETVVLLGDTQPNEPDSQGGGGAVRRHMDNILTYYQRPVANSMSEGLNSKIQKIKSWLAASATPSTSRRRPTSTAEGSICTHANPGSDDKNFLTAAAGEGHWSGTLRGARRSWGGANEW